MTDATTHLIDDDTSPAEAHASILTALERRLTDDRDALRAAKREAAIQRYRAEKAERHFVARSEAIERCADELEASLDADETALRDAVARIAVALRLNTGGTQ
jgi:molecular chaperone GrpE (heat shock protein)